MSLHKPSQLWVASGAELAEGAWTKISVLFSGRPASIFVFKKHGAVHAYLNQCVHMPRTLDCERSDVFDSSGNFLRCSMHGIVFDPATGASLSTLCEGQRLTSIRLVLDEAQSIWIRDKRVKPLVPN